MGKQFKEKFLKLVNYIACCLLSYTLLRLEKKAIEYFGRIYKFNRSIKNTVVDLIK